MNATVLPDKIFMIGTRESQTKFTPAARKIADGILCVCMWTTIERLEGWLSRQENRRNHFQIETPMAFAGLVVAPSVRYVYVDPTGDENPYDKTFVVDSFPIDRRIDLHSFADVGDCLCTIHPEISESLRQFALLHPKLRPHELLKGLAADTDLKSNFLHRPGKELRAMGVFDEAVASIWQQLLQTYNVGATSRRLFMEVWEAHTELTAVEASAYLSEMMGSRIIADLKATGDFEIIWRDVEAKSLERGEPTDVIERAKIFVAASNELTFLDAVEMVKGSMGAIDDPTEQFPPVVKKAFLTFPPPSECRVCGEVAWDFVSLSPNEKSAIWRCSYCRREIIVKADDIRRRAVRAKREPIPKEVQREVWRRDGGKCVACGGQERLEFDHIIPHSRGGANTSRNLQLLCENCNREKRDKSPGDY